jgi:hypothetical protein
MKLVRIINSPSPNNHGLAMSGYTYAKTMPWRNIAEKPKENLGFSIFE